MRLNLFHLASNYFSLRLLNYSVFRLNHFIDLDFYLIHSAVCDFLLLYYAVFWNFCLLYLFGNLFDLLSTFLVLLNCIILLSLYHLFVELLFLLLVLKL